MSIFDSHTFTPSPNPRTSSCVICGRLASHNIHPKSPVTKGERLYKIYETVFAYRHPLPWESLPLSDERNLWEQIAEQYSRVKND